MKLKRNSLRAYNGRKGQKAYIAYKSKVYDVTELFTDGEHRSCIAGNDLTDVLDMMPHGAEVVERFPLVGELED